MKKPKLYAPVLTFLLLLCGLSFAGNDSEDPPEKRLPRLIPERGTVTFAEGNVEIRRKKSGWEPLYAGGRVRPDDSLRTRSDGRVEVSWADPIRILRVERESVVALGGAAVGNRLVLVGARVDLGAVWTKVVGLRRPFVLSSPSIRSTFDRATLATRVEDETSRLAVYQGQVDLDDRSLTGGQGILVSTEGIRPFDVATEDDLRDGWRDIVLEALPAETTQTERNPETQRFTRDLRDLSPEIYLGVEIELTGRATNETTFKMEEARIRKIRIKSAKWDDMLPARKVQLLNDTFYVLKERYPNILETIVLEFDDDRPRLSLKYATAG
jgi:hypothetical protein